MEPPKAERPLPSWLTQGQDYQPQTDQDGFITKSILSVSSALALLRLDDGAAARFSPSAPVKLAFGLVSILLVSLSQNYLFVMLTLAGVLARATLLPQRTLTRVATTAAAASLLAFVVMLPAALLGQPRSALTIAGKTLVSTGIAMEVALTTPAAELTGALRAYRVPNLFIMTLDLALRSIVRLGEAALEVLTALRLRSVGRNRRKGSAMGGVGGVVLLKAAEASQQTYDAMRCRGFEGTYDAGPAWRPRAVDAPWLCLLAGLVIAFAYLQGLM